MGGAIKTRSLRKPVRSIVIISMNPKFQKIGGWTSTAFSLASRNGTGSQHKSRLPFMSV